MADNNDGFEKDMSALEEIVVKLEKGGLELDESLKLFEEGTALFKNCRKMLDDAQAKIDVLFEETGDWRSKPLNPESSRFYSQASDHEYDAEDKE